MHPSKVITLSGHRIKIFGVSVDDHYFQNVGDNLDPEYNRVVEMNVPRDGVSVDVGANIGLKAIQLAHRAPFGRVLAVEAAPRVYECLAASVAVSGLRNIITEHAAITDREGTVMFEDNSAYGHISPRGVEVPATTLGTLIERHRLKRLDFVKIDVEGFEFPILRASLPVFLKHGTIVCFEFNSWCMTAFTDEHPRLCLEWLLNTFTEVYLLRRSKPPQAQMERIRSDGALDILAKNMIEDGHVSDIVVCMETGKVKT